MRPGHAPDHPNWVDHCGMEPWFHSGGNPAGLEQFPFFSLDIASAGGLPYAIMRFTMRHSFPSPCFPWLVPFVLFWAGLFCAVRGVLQATDSIWVYTIDDPYIHMAMAKNLAFSGVYGVTPFEFSSSSSSPLWTLFLGGMYRIFGLSDLLPGILAAGCAGASIYLADRIGRIMGLGPWARLLCNVCIVGLAPLIPLISTGMEHAAHLLLGLGFLLAYVSHLEKPGCRPAFNIFCLAALATGVRYETLFVVLPLGAYLYIRNRRGAALLLLLSASLPVVIYGVVSVAHGNAFLPNSLLLKGHFPAARTAGDVVAMLGGRAIRALWRAPHLLLLLLPLAVAAWLPAGRFAHRPGLSACFLFAVMLHLQFADTGWFYRYEAYLMPPLLLLAFAAFAERWSRCLRLCPGPKRTTARLVVVLCAMGILTPAVGRGRQAWRDVTPAASHVYREQYQIAHFVKAMYPPGVRIALNDLGALSYYPDSPHILDLWGLGSFEVANIRRGKADHANGFARLLEDFQPDLIVVYPDWFGDVLPPTLCPVATWSSPAHYWNAGSVSFFATTPARAESLKNNLRQYEPRLPASVTVRYDDSPLGGISANPIR